MNLYFTLISPSIHVSSSLIIGDGEEDEGEVETIQKDDRSFEIFHQVFEERFLLQMSGTIDAKAEIAGSRTLWDYLGLCGTPRIPKTREVPESREEFEKTSMSYWISDGRTLLPTDEGTS
jgi:hypothetical protein